MEEWDRLMDVLDHSQLQNNGLEDNHNWVFEKFEVYSTKSIYRNMMFMGVINKRMEKLWYNKAPMKIKVSMWMLVQHKLQTGVNMKKKNWQGSRKVQRPLIIYFSIVF